MLNTLFNKDNILKEKMLAGDGLLSNYFHEREPGLVKTIHFPERKKRTRLVVKKGIENIFILLENIVLFYTENKIVYAIDKIGKKFITNENLAILELELDKNIFFRANRQYIINLNFVKCYKAFEKVKLQVDLNISERNHSIIISQITAPYFRKWISEA